jgi:hypothetical protein
MKRPSTSSVRSICKILLSSASASACRHHHPILSEESFFFNYQLEKPHIRPGANDINQIFRGNYSFPARKMPAGDPKEAKFS